MGIRTRGYFSRDYRVYIGFYRGIILGFIGNKGIYWATPRERALYEGAQIQWKRAFAHHTGMVLSPKNYFSLWFRV